jgi:hypothetical protein
VVRAEVYTETIDQLSVEAERAAANLPAWVRPYAETLLKTAGQTAVVHYYLLLELEPQLNYHEGVEAKGSYAFLRVERAAPAGNSVDAQHFAQLCV